VGESYLGQNILKIISVRDERGSSAKTSRPSKNTRGNKRREKVGHLKEWLHRQTSPVSSNRPSIHSTQKKVLPVLVPPSFFNLDAAESTLKNEARTQPDFLTNLLTLIATPQAALPIRQAAALFFKNFVRQNWKVRRQY
jgi:hypothetical protein